MLTSISDPAEIPESNINDDRMDNEIISLYYCNPFDASDLKFVVFSGCFYVIRSDLPKKSHCG